MTKQCVASDARQSSLVPNKVKSGETLSVQLKAREKSPASLVADRAID